MNTHGDVVLSEFEILQSPVQMHIAEYGQRHFLVAKTVPRYLAACTYPTRQ